jgi:uncharacterized membrane protein YjjB (DUF3815 family)
MDTWKILVIGIIMFIIGFLMMMNLASQQGVLNIGTFIGAIGLVIIYGTVEKYRRGLKNWIDR